MTKSSHSHHVNQEAAAGSERRTLRRGEAKRTAALDAAVQLFLEQGFGRTSLQQIAKAADVSTATLFKHFPTKASLFGALMGRLWEAEGDAEPPPMPPAGDPEAGLKAIGRDYARLLRQPHTEALFRVIIAEAPRFPELGRELYERGKKPYLARLEAYLGAEAAVGSLAAPDVALAARQFLGMINDVIFWPRLLIADLRVTSTDAERVVDAAVDTMLARYRP